MISVSIRQRSERKFCPPPTGARSGGPEKLKVNCLVVTVKIMFNWYNNVVATNIAEIEIYFCHIV